MCVLDTHDRPNFQIFFLNDVPMSKCQIQMPTPNPNLCQGLCVAMLTQLCQDVEQCAFFMLSQGRLDVAECAFYERVLLRHSSAMMDGGFWKDVPRPHLHDTGEPPGGSSPKFTIPEDYAPRGCQSVPP